MLTEFEGIIDRVGLRTLRECDTNLAESGLDHQPDRIRIWAVLELESAQAVIKELRSGYRARAHRMLEELAVSFGTRHK